MNKTAIILGATGLTGNIILQKLIKDKRYETIKLFSRTKIEGLPSKVKQYIGNLLEFETFEEQFTADEVYTCIGTTLKKTPDKSLYKAIDYGIPLAAAKLAKQNSIDTYLVISALGADSNSSVFYNKTKGEMEDGILNQDIINTHILRPSLIEGDRDETRILEKIALIAIKLIQPLLIGKLKQYKSVKAESIANAMVYLANTKNKYEVIIASEEIKKLGTNN